MKILLINPPFPILPNETRYASPPLGLAYIAAVLEEKGHTVRIVDCVAAGYATESNWGDGRRYYGLSRTEIIANIVDFKPQLIGISCLFSTVANIVIEIAAICKRQLKNVKVVLGGTHPTVFAEKIAAEEVVDYVIKGEGEHALLQLVEHLYKQRSLDAVSNLFCYKSGVAYSTKRSFIDDLDALPRPARHLLDLEKYIEIGRMHGENGSGVRATTLITSRGCPFDCVYCSIHPVWGYKYRPRSPENVLAEIEALYHDHGIRHFLFEDDNLTLNRQRATAIFSGIAERFPAITWSTPNGVAVFTLDKDLLSLIKDSGCSRLSLAVESGCQRTLDEIIRKPLKLEKAKEVAASCRQLGLPTTAFFVLGLPGETVGSMEQSMRFAESLPVSSLSIMAATPYPGTRLYKICQENGYFVGNFEPDRLYTLNPQIQTQDFLPCDVRRLTARAYFGHALKHPGGNLRRFWQKLRASPISTLSFFLNILENQIGNLTHSKNQPTLFKIGDEGYGIDKAAAFHQKR